MLCIKKVNYKFSKAILSLLLVMVFCFAGMAMLFSNFIGRYKENIVSESASHLSEINAQIKIYVEEKINNDWKVTQSIANSINAYSPQESDAMIALLQQERDIWQVSDIYIYTQDGNSISAERDIKNNDTASDLIYNAKKHGKYMTILRSTVTYTVPIETETMLNGSKVVALSIVQDLESFVDNMGISSFDGSSYVFLTQENGSKISQLTTTGAPDLYNAFTLFDGKSVKCLNVDDFVFDGSFPTDQAYTFLVQDKTGGEYLLSTPIQTDSGTWRLFYAVPEEVANKTTNDFSSYVTLLSISVMAVFSLCGIIAFIAIYRNRQRKFDRELIARDRMLDLLVTNTRNAFALLSTQQATPLYMSSNAKQIIGDISLRLVGNEQGYSVENFEGEETDSIRAINAELKDWNAKEEFASPFIPYIDDSGTQRHFVLRIYPVESDPDEFIAIAQDVTQEREREETLKNALAVADSANVAKTRFLSNMSHDIRTPMNAIVNMTNFALESMDDKQSQREYLNTIRDSADHLLHLINDILDMSRIESGKTSIESAPFDLSKCLHDVCEIVAPLCAAKKLAFSTNYNELKNTQLLGDKLKLSQVLINLLNNAVKFTPENGTIQFNVSELPSLKSKMVSLRFDVSDTGMGISKENLEHIFDPFVRENGGRVQQIEGSGLGLSICKSYVTAMGGKISCESKVDKGSTFTIELFFEKDSTASSTEIADTAAQGITFDGKHALVCEDHKVNQAIAKKILEKLGFAVDIASDGAEGSQKFISSENDCYDIIYMDIQMPVMTGYEAAQAIRQSGHPQAKTIPIIAMTANVFAEDVERARVAGMNGHIGKPIVIENLISETQKVIGKEETL